MFDGVYYNGEYRTLDAIQISPLDRGWLLGDGVYEVTPVYRGIPYGLDRHLARFDRSTGALRIANDVHDWQTVAQELIHRNNLAQVDKAIIYMQITRGAARRSHAFPSPAVSPTGYAYAAPFPAVPDPDIGCAAITVSDVRWSRCDVKVISLVANCLANQEAHDANAYEALFIRDGMLLEGTHTNAFAVVDGIVRTAPLTNYVLPGITRELVLELCHANGIAYTEFPVAANELRSASEIFITGTSTEVLGVSTLDGRPVGTGKTGPITQRIRDLYRASTPRVSQV